MQVQVQNDCPKKGVNAGARLLNNNDDELELSRLQNSCCLPVNLPCLLSSILFTHPVVHLGVPPSNMDLSRFCAAPSARLGRFPFESDRAFPTQC